MNTSIRNRLLLILLPLTLVIWGAAVVAIFTTTQREAEELIEAQLAQSARVLMSLIGHEVQEHKASLVSDISGEIMLQLRQIPEFEYQNQYEQKIAFQVLTLKDHQILLRSQGAPAFRMSDDDFGFSDRVIGGLPWSVYTLTDPKLEVQVQVGQTLGPRKDTIARIALRLITPLLFAIPLLGIIIWYGVGQAMRPLRIVARDVKRRRPDNLHPIVSDIVPAEVEPLIDALNKLFNRLQRAFETERRFTSDAAHELRTPLAALKAHAQVALRTTDDSMRREALVNVIAGVDRAVHLSEQLLILARIDPEIWAGREHVKLSEVATAVLADIAPSALAKNIELSLDDSSDAAVIHGDRTMISILLRNLVDNAIKYSPKHGSVEVRLERSGSWLNLKVADSGPGIPPEERARVFERFYRLAGTQPPGSGLGLSIVKRIAELHRAKIRLDASHLGGLLAEVSFPIEPPEGATPSLSQA
jgi:two-component system sensor histidine kinase QseC